MSVQSELLAIAKANKGRLAPKKVVEFARDPKTALHGRLLWDNTRAGDRYRLQQAAEIIRRFKVVIRSEKMESVKIRAFVSLANERDGSSGYRETVRVLSNKELRAEMLRTALMELQAFRRKYSILSELKGVLFEIERVLDEQGGEHPPTR